VRGFVIREPTDADRLYAIPLPEDIKAFVLLRFPPSSARSLCSWPLRSIV